jgi:methylphosphotriester-DNA--protein-cysteine methyltransferase
MIGHSSISDADVRKQIRHGEICLGGNRRLKIYGTLGCRSGKRMKRENRVFLASVAEAIQQGYRPCARCMNHNYKQWKNGSVQ